MPLRLSVVTPERPVVETDVDSVVCPGAEGEFGVLPDHEPFLAPLQKGSLRYRPSAGGGGAGGAAIQTLEITGGFAEVTGERVTILADAVQAGSGAAR